MESSKENRIATLNEPLTSNPESENEEAVAKPNSEYKYQEDKRWIGYVFQLMHVTLVCGHQLISKVMYQRRPELTTAQLLVLRSLACLSVMLFIIRFRVKHFMYDTIPKSQVLVLFLRVTIGVFNMFCQYYTIKYFPLVFVSLV